MLIIKYQTFILLLVCLFLSITNSNAQFRNSTWGDSKEDVMAVEGEFPDPNSEVFVYDGTAGGKSVFILFIFIDNSLEATSYIFDSTDKLSEFLTDYVEINELLVENYGNSGNNIERITHKPEIAESKFLDELNKLELGAISYQSNWKTDDAEIIHKLANDGSNLVHSVFYKSENYDQLSKQRHLDDF